VFAYDDWEVVRMHWVGYLTVVGLWARAAREAGLAPAGRPVVILRDGQAFDGCREAFVGGLVLGAPARQVGRDLPGAVLIPVEEVEAEAHGRAWWDRLLSRTPYIEPLAPETVWIGLPTPGEGMGERVKAEFRALREVAAEAGFIAFGGLGSSRPVARAAALACRDGWLAWRPGKAVKASPQPFRIVAPGEEAAFLAPLPIGLLGLPGDLERRLRRLGIQTAGAAAKIPEAEWVRQFGAEGRRIANWSRGIEPDRIRASYPERSIARRIDLAGEAVEPDALEALINRAATAIAKELADRGEGCQEVALELVEVGGAQRTGSRTLPRLQQRAYALQQSLGHVLRQVYTKSAPLSALVVRVTGIGPMPWEQMVLWGETAVPDKEAKLEEVLTLLHERFPSRLIGRGPRQSTSWREQMLTYCDPFRHASESSWHA
jgi:hypothetical protein